MSEPTVVARAVAALRRGAPVSMDGMSLLSVETAAAAMLEAIDPHAKARLLISGERAAALGLANEALAATASKPVLVERADWLDRATALSIVDPAGDFGRGPIGPLSPAEIKNPGLARAALRLSRLAGLLPAMWILKNSRDGAFAIAAEQVLDSRVEAQLVARARLPIADVPEAQILVFRDGGTGEEHVALLVGSFGGRPPLVRLHSECLTGDVFGSLKCDCGPQLHAALKILADQGGGVLLYLRQEGRGIGLANKIRAYQLQDRGLDTVDANRRLGFPDDLRDYAMAAAMLRALGVQEVRLLTNNPAKVDGLRGEGIDVVERVAHHMPANPHNQDYLATKQRRSGHLP